MECRSLSRKSSIPSPAQPASWRDQIPIHPVAKAHFEPLPAGELAALAADIAAHGLHSPIVLWTDPAGIATVIDGANRLDALWRNNGGFRIEDGVPVGVG